MQAKNGAARGQPGGGGGNVDAAGNLRHSYSTADESRKQEPAHGKLSGIVWTKSVRASVHMLRTPKGWALDVADLELAEQRGARLVHLHDREVPCDYWASIETLRAHGWLFDRGCGRQLGLSLAWWRPSREQAEELAEPEPESLVIQGALW